MPPIAPTPIVSRSPTPIVIGIKRERSNTDADLSPCDAVIQDKKGGDFQSPPAFHTRRRAKLEAHSDKESETST